MFSQIVIIKSGGDLGSAVAHRLQQSGFSVIITEKERPVSIRRRVSFSEAIYEQEVAVEGVVARKVCKEDPQGIVQLSKTGIIPVVADENLEILSAISPDIVIDATLRKKNVDMHQKPAPITIALGPGFSAPEDVDAVIETNRGHNLGRIYYRGTAMENTGIPGAILGVRRERVIYSGAEGIFHGGKNIGDLVTKGQIIGEIYGSQKTGEAENWDVEKRVVEMRIVAPIDGMIRGLIREGSFLHKGMKIGDVDPRGEKAYVDLISDKGRTISGGVLEAILHLINK